MQIERIFPLDPFRAISGIEDLAESFWDPRFREDYTIKGITIGKSRDGIRPLLPKRYRTRLGYQAAVGINWPSFEFLLNAAKQIQRRGTFSNAFEPPERFNFGDLVRHNLDEGESVSSVLEHFEVLGRDDLSWFFWLRYNRGNLVCAVGDNTKWTDPDEKFQALYERFFGKYFISK